TPSLRWWVVGDTRAEAGPPLRTERRVRAGLAAEEVEDLGETGRGGRGDRRRGVRRRRSGGRSAEAGHEIVERASGEVPVRTRRRRRTRGGRPVARAQPRATRPPPARGAPV